MMTLQANLSSRTASPGDVSHDLLSHGCSLNNTSALSAIHWTAPHPGAMVNDDNIVQISRTSTEVTEYSTAMESAESKPGKPVVSSTQTHHPRRLSTIKRPKNILQSEEPVVDDDSEPFKKYFTIVAPPTIRGEQDMGMRWCDNKIVQVIPGKWAAQNGVEANDVLWAVNDQSFATMTFGEKNIALEVPDALKLSLTFKRPVVKDEYRLVELGIEAPRVDLGVEFKSNTVYISESSKQVIEDLSMRNVVEGLHPAKWATQNGLNAAIESGDELREVNNIPFFELFHTNEEVQMVLNNVRPLTLTFRRVNPLREQLISAWRKTEQ